MRHESPDVAPMHQIYFQSSSKDTTQNSTPEKASLKASSLVGLSTTPTAEHMCLFLFHTVTAINIRIRSLLSQAMEVDLYFYLLNAAIKKKKKKEMEAWNNFVLWRACERRCCHVYDEIFARQQTDKLEQTKRIIVWSLLSHNVVLRWRNGAELYIFDFSLYIFFHCCNGIFNRMPTCVSKQERQAIILMGCTMSQRAICASTKCPMGTSNKMLQAYYKKGWIAYAPRHQPDWWTSAKEDILIVAATADDPFLSAHEIRDELGLTYISPPRPMVPTAWSKSY